MKSALLVICIIFSLISSAWAQQAAGKTETSIFVSGIKLLGDENDESIINFASGISLKYSFSLSFTGQLSAGLGWVRPKDPDFYFKVKANAPYRTYLYYWNINLRYNLIPERKINPYIGLGAGLTHWNLRNVSGEDKWFPIPASGKSISGAQINTTLLGTIGTEIYISEKYCLDIGIRYHQLLDQDLNNVNPAIEDANNSLLEVRVGLGLNFGGFRDFDKDGFEDKADSDPYHAEDFDGFEDEDGAPDPDNDNDGIPDDKDEAPDLPEDRDGFQDMDGVPDLDNDNDGILDSQDQAPNRPEDFDGFRDEDGIPDPDNDNDGISDLADDCPNEPETFNDYQDNDGCPDQKPKPPLSFQPGKRLILDNISFQSGKTFLTEKTMKELDKVIETLKIQPEIKIEIRGFTDSRGKASYNLNLSQLRAEAVRDYVINYGISFDRLKPIGYGEADPVATNKTAAGRVKNRRIEFYLLEQ
jgi:outer membrane protein OmpA-like peptidoglycan-associated protein/opacity protein-like surface antigen